MTGAGLAGTIVGIVMMLPFAALAIEGVLWVRKSRKRRRDEVAERREAAKRVMFEVTQDPFGGKGHWWGPDDNN